MCSPSFGGGRRIQIGFQAAKPWNASNSCGRMATSHLRSLVDVGRVWLWSSTQCDCPTVGLWVSDGSNSPLGHYGHLDNLDDSKVIIVTDFWRTSKKPPERWPNKVWHQHVPIKGRQFLSPTSPWSHGTFPKKLCRMGILVWSLPMTRMLSAVSNSCPSSRARRGASDLGWTWHPWCHGMERMISLLGYCRYGPVWLEMKFHPLHPTKSNTHLLNAFGKGLRLRFVVTSLTELLLILWKKSCTTW